MSELLYYDLKEVAGLARSLSSQVAREIGRRIVSGNYAPGDLIEDEAALAARYQVSRSVVRDAVKILVGKGLLEVRRGIGTRVRPRSSWGLLDDDVLAWHQSIPPSSSDLRQLLEVRQVVEPHAAGWAAERGTEDEVGLIRAALERMEHAQGSVEDFVVADAAFHRSVLRAAKNEFLGALEGAIFSALLGSIRLTNKSSSENAESMPFHVAVCEAIEAREAGPARQAMQRLLGDTNRRLGGRLFEET